MVANFSLVEIRLSSSNVNEHLASINEILDLGMLLHELQLNLILIGSRSTHLFVTTVTGPSFLLSLDLCSLCRESLNKLGLILDLAIRKQREYQRGKGCCLVQVSLVHLPVVILLHFSFSLIRINIKILCLPPSSLHCEESSLEIISPAPIHILSLISIFEIWLTAPSFGVRDCAALVVLNPGSESFGRGVREMPYSLRKLLIFSSR